MASVVIIGLIARRFSQDLRHNPDLWQLSWHPGWLSLAGSLYLGGLLLSLCYWVRLLRELGQQPRPVAALRAYYVGMMGKYLPGKAWALIFRALLVRGPGVHLGIATMTSFYEVLTTMTSGALLSAILFALLAPRTDADLNWRLLGELVRLETPTSPMLDRSVLVLLALGLAAGTGIPVVPVVFNRLVHHLSLPFRDADSELPLVKTRSFLEGLFMTSFCWWGMGASLWAVLYNVLPEPLAFTPELWARLTAYMALAYIAGFVILLVPSGLGVREFFLMLFLVPEITARFGDQPGDARALAVLAVILLRLVWTAAEVVLTAFLYWLPGQSSATLLRSAEVIGEGG